MRRLRLDEAAVVSAVARAQRRFATRDISEDPLVMGARSDLKELSSYHARVGRALSELSGTLRLSRVGSGSRGVIWEREEHVTDAVAAGERTGIGPQNPGDDPWAARMRLHQSWWRAEVLQLP